MVIKVLRLWSIFYNFLLQSLKIFTYHKLFPKIYFYSKMKHDYSKLEDKVVNIGTDISTTTNRTGPLIYTSLFFYHVSLILGLNY